MEAPHRRSGPIAAVAPLPDAPPPGFDSHAYSHRWEIDRPRAAVWTWLCDPSTFVDGQLWPYRVEFLADATGRSGFTEGVYNAHVGPFMSFSGVLGEIEPERYRDLQYFYGSYAISHARQAVALEALAVPGHRRAFDLRDSGACEAAIEAAVGHAGSLDIVVNATGVVAFGSVEELSIDTMEELFLTNAFIPIMLAKAALEVMGEGGTIVNISGVIAEQNLPGMAAYGASKAAVRSFDDALAREARRRKIRILDARPPHTETGLADRSIAGVAPKMPTGLEPASVAATICDAIAGDSTDLPSAAFAP